MRLCLNFGSDSILSRSDHAFFSIIMTLIPGFNDTWALASPTAPESDEGVVI